LQPPKTHLRRWDLIPRFAAIVIYDVARSNIAVARLILTGGQHGQRRSGFVEVPLDLRDDMALAVLAIVLTGMPGTAWMQYDAAQGTLLLHVFDLAGEANWADLVKNRYERLLMEIFE
jgi:multicomponent K+:H+ antiporter subunit E